MDRDLAIKLLTDASNGIEVDSLLLAQARKLLPSLAVKLDNAIKIKRPVSLAKSLYPPKES